MDGCGDPLPLRVQDGGAGRQGQLVALLVGLALAVGLGVPALEGVVGVGELVRGDGLLAAGGRGYRVLAHIAGRGLGILVVLESGDLDGDDGLGQGACAGRASVWAGVGDGVGSGVGIPAVLASGQAAGARVSRVGAGLSGDGLLEDLVSGFDGDRDRDGLGALQLVQQSHADAVVRVRVLVVLALNEGRRLAAVRAHAHAQAGTALRIGGDRFDVAAQLVGQGHALGETAGHQLIFDVGFQVLGDLVAGGGEFGLRLRAEHVLAQMLQLRQVLAVALQTDRCEVLNVVAVRGGELPRAGQRAGIGFFFFVAIRASPCVGVSVAEEEHVRGQLLMRHHVRRTVERGLPVRAILGAIEDAVMSSSSSSRDGHHDPVQVRRVGAVRHHVLVPVVPDRILLPRAAGEQDHAHLHLARRHQTPAQGTHSVRDLVILSLAHRTGAIQNEQGMFPVLRVVTARGRQVHVEHVRLVSRGHRLRCRQAGLVGVGGQRGAGDDAAGQQGRHGGRRRGHPAQPFPLLHRNSFQAPGSLPGIQLP